MKKWLKRVLLFAAFLLLAAVVMVYWLPVSFGGKRPQRLEALPGDTVLSAEQVEKDRQQLIGYVESTHPFFVDGSDRTGYDAAKEKYIAATSGPMTVNDFMGASAEYLTVFGDGHTKLSWQYGGEALIYHSYQDGKMYYGDGKTLTDQWITAVDGVPTEQILSTIDRLFPAENEMAVVVNYNYYFTSETLLRMAGLNVAKDNFTVTLSDGTETVCGWYVAEDSPENKMGPERNHFYWDGDIFVVRFVSCDDDENLRSIAGELKKAVDGGCTKVIIDARGNGGGSSNACERLLNAMGMKSPRYGMLVRFSKGAAEQCGYLRSHGQFMSKPSQSARQNNKVQLAVLCDRHTYSSATMLCVYVRDGGLGKIIGEASSNMPNSYGDITFVALENSRLYASVSHKRFLRPSGKTEDRMLRPDIATSSADAYGAAVEYLNKK